MEPIKKWNMVKVALVILVISLALTAYLTSFAFAGRNACRENGWMTGGGSIFPTDGNIVTYGGQVADDGRVTHGFVLHCYERNSDNLQVVNHALNQSFHLETVYYTACIDDPGISPNPPDADFDTIMGGGLGRCKQPDRECWAEWKFTDGGERGGCLRDTAIITVKDMTNNQIVFSISGDVDCGNHQAHSK